MKKSVQICGKIHDFFFTKNKKCRHESVFFIWDTPYIEKVSQTLEEPIQAITLAK
jgi:hypothetical protein